MSKIEYLSDEMTIEDRTSIKTRISVGAVISIDQTDPPRFRDVYNDHVVFRHEDLRYIVDYLASFIDDEEENNEND